MNIERSHLHLYQALQEVLALLKLLNHPSFLEVLQVLVVQLNLRLPFHLSDQVLREDLVDQADLSNRYLRVRL